MIDHIRDIRDSIETAIVTELGADYKELAYVNDIAKNSFRTNNDRYGVIPRGASETSGVTKYVTIIQSFEVVLTKGYYESNLDDSGQIERSLDNRENMLCIYKRLVNTQGGLPSIVINVQNLFLSEPEYLIDDKVAIQRATMDIMYRFSLI